MTPKSWVGVGSIAIALTATSTASAEALDCAKTVDEGIQARMAGKLRQARDYFIACAAQCASTLQSECASLAQATLDATPSIVVEARDAQGNELRDVTVTVDDDLVAAELDGRAFPLDPGAHTLSFSRRGRVVTESIIANEGTKGRPVRVTIGGLDPDAPVRDAGGHTVWPWAVAAIGGAIAVGGLAIVLTTPKLP